VHDDTLAIAVFSKQTLAWKADMGAEAIIVRPKVSLVWVIDVEGGLTCVCSPSLRKDWQRLV